MTDEVTLLPCPFGCKDLLAGKVSGKRVGFIECMECGATGPERGSLLEAIEAWNRRSHLRTPRVEAGDEQRDVTANELAALDALPEVDHAQLFRFYNVTSAVELISAQSLHIKRLQSKLPTARDEFPRNYREG